jgi:hypothetical protein
VTHSKRVLVCAGLLAFLGCAASNAATIVTTPVGLLPGTQYQLVFVTSDLFFASTSSISTYNGDVAAEAALNATLAAFDTANGVTWTVIGSTSAVNANVNAPSSGLVYTLDGTKVASSGVYSGSLLSAIDITQFGNTLSGNVWTGSTTSGTAQPITNVLGGAFPEYGLSNSTTGSWIAFDNNIPQSPNTALFYALSSVITVPSTTVPEPGTAALTLGALLLLSVSRLRWRGSMPKA